MEVRLDAPDGKLIATIVVPNTRDQFQEFTAKLNGAQGIHDLYFVFKGCPQQQKNLFNFDWWEIKN